MTHRGGQVAVLVALLVGCSDNFKPSGGGERPRGTFPSRAPQPVAAAAPPSSPAPVVPPEPTLQQQVAEATEAEKKKETPKRDYSAELLAAVGSPIDCLKPRNAGEAPSELQVDLEGHFLETGAVTRGYARSSQLEADELDCIRRKLEAVHLTAPIEQAPRTVTTTLRLTLKIPEKSSE